MARGIEGLSREIAALFSDPEFMKKFEVLPGEKQIELMDQVLNPPSKEAFHSLVKSWSLYPSRNSPNSQTVQLIITMLRH